MRHISKVVKFQLLNFKKQTLTCFSIIVLNIMISLVVSHFMQSEIDGSNVSVGSIDIVAFIWIFILGIGFFKPSFKYMLSNGISRKKFFLASIQCFLIVAAGWSIAITLLTIISRRYTNIFMLYELLYKNLSALSLIAWMFAAFFLLSIFGWFINLIYYRSGSRVKLLISFFMFALAPLLLFFNIISSGIIFNAMAQFFIVTMGFSTNFPNPYIGTLSMLIFAMIICGFNFLLIRKAQVKE